MLHPRLSQTSAKETPSLMLCSAQHSIFSFGLHKGGVGGPFGGLVIIKVGDNVLSVPTVGVAPVVGAKVKGGLLSITSYGLIVGMVVGIS